MDTNSILVVDDELAYLELVKGLLNQEGYENITTEDNPLKVMPLLEQQLVDLILLDIYMPEMNGLERTQRHRADANAGELVPGVRPLHRPKLKVFCPTLGKAKLAQMLSRAGLHLATTTVGRTLK